MTKTLAHITSDLIATQTKLELSEGEIDLLLEDELNSISKELETKADSYAYRMEKLELMVSYWKEKSKEASNVAYSIEAHVQNMRSRIKDTMQILDKKEIKGETHKFTVRPTPQPKLIIEGPIDPAYLVETITFGPDKERIKKCLTDGEIIKNARLEQSITLNIRLNKGE